MKIRIYIQQREHSSNDYWIDEHYKYEPFKGAYPETKIIEEKWQIYPNTTGEQYIAYTDDGAPYIATRRIETWEEPVEWQVDNWKKYGDNHQYNAEKHLWTRDNRTIEWYFDIDETDPMCWKQLVDLVANGYVHEITKLRDGTYEVTSNV